MNIHGLHMAVFLNDSTFRETLHQGIFYLNITELLTSQPGINHLHSYQITYFF
jgi:hypothetical protein